MRLRDRRNILFTLTTLLLFMIILLMGFGIIDFRIGPGSQVMTESLSAGNDNESADFIYQGENTDTVINPPDADNYSAGELENINVYDRFNEAVVNITTEVVGYNWFLEPVPRKGSSGSSLSMVRIAVKIPESGGVKETSNISEPPGEMTIGKVGRPLTPKTPPKFDM